MSKGIKVLIITVAALLVLGVVFVGVAFAADSSGTAALPGCCTNESTCNGYCAANGGVCQPGNCVANCPGTCNSNVLKTGSGSCCTSTPNVVPQNTGGAGGCCGLR